METLKEFSEDKEKQIESDVSKIRRIFKDEYKLSLPSHCDAFIKRCIRLKDGNLVKAAHLAHQFQRTSSEIKTWNVSVCPSEFEDLYKSGIAIPVKTPESFKSRIFILKTGLWDTKKYDFEQVFIGLWLLTQHIQIQFEDSQRNGAVVILDFTNFSINHILAVNHFKLLRTLKWMQCGVAGRYKSLHVIFHPRAIGMLYAGVRPFLKDKIKNRIIFHGDSVTSLHEHVDPIYLPEFLGGTYPNDSKEFVDTAILKDICEKDEFFKDMLKFGFPSQ